MAPPMLHPSNLRLNAALLSPEESMNLADRQASQDELSFLQAIHDLYAVTPTPPLSNRLFSSEVIFTLPSGSVAVGTTEIQSTFNNTFSAHPSRQVLRQRLLHTPDTLAGKENARTKFVVVDQELAFFDEAAIQESMRSVDEEMEMEVQPKRVVRSLIVARIEDGLVASISEEEDHKKSTAPLAARRAAASNSFYSPSDNVLSPTSSKLKLVKQKHQLKVKPVSLFGKPQLPSGLQKRLAESTQAFSPAQQQPRSGLSQQMAAGDMSL
ncbi:hypothetical protein K437DRAFT_259431 [Tilletiaria anomala UBC 951]|uniref:Uncharacterized protein n=1 Tax=Tilletiaria anomala (strain ATCC 24038 / CBS 436.72 / UBC 951) TaxID=1037660 RepID=A0A066VAC4_TILAU|nr:uncharacterized protein K437DRAFT_259431 [Tilletiaria anomala UBC 951]KDN38391.1 hypothetical protein K437DRAFT_259431 [Tilletiaria anomala UBC 951]